MITMQGKRRTRYSGTLNLLFPRSRIRFLKKDSGGVIFWEASRSDAYCRDLRVGRSSVEGTAGSRFWRPLMTSMMAAMSGEEALGASLEACRQFRAVEEGPKCLYPSARRMREGGWEVTSDWRKEQRRRTALSGFVTACKGCVRTVVTGWVVRRWRVSRC